jgi:hypothetical protein
MPGADIQAGQLDNVPRRYAWFRRVLKSHDEQDSPLFPPTWEVTRLLVGSFSEYTRTDLGNVLGKGVPTVNVLLEALQGTLDFEGVMEKRLEMGFEEIVEIGLPGQPGRGKWRISSVFDQHFSIYVDAQDRCVSLSSPGGEFGLMIVRLGICLPHTAEHGPDRQWKVVCKMRPKRTQHQRSYHRPPNYSISTVRQWNNVGNTPLANHSENWVKCSRNG